MERSFIVTIGAHVGPEEIARRVLAKNHPGNIRVEPIGNTSDTYHMASHPLKAKRIIALEMELTPLVAAIKAADATLVIKGPMAMANRPTDCIIGYCSKGKWSPTLAYPSTGKNVHEVVVAHISHDNDIQYEIDKVVNFVKKQGVSKLCVAGTNAGLPLAYYARGSNGKSPYMLWKARLEFFYTEVFKELAKLTFPIEDDIEDVVDCVPSTLTRERKPLVAIPFQVEDYFPSTSCYTPLSEEDDDISEEDDGDDGKPFLSWDVEARQPRAVSSVHMVISPHGNRLLDSLSRQPPPLKKARRV